MNTLLSTATAPWTVAIVVATFFAAGCTSISGLSGSSSYACKAPEGVACDSVSGTYANAQQNNLPSQRQRAMPAGAAASSPALAPVPPASRAGVQDAVLAIAPPTSVSLRTAPRILRLWFKPWEDADHDLYDQGYVYVQVDAGQWRIEHVQRQIRENYAPLKVPPRATSNATERPLLPANPKSAPRPGPGEPSGALRPDVPAPRTDNPTE